MLLNINPLDYAKRLLAQQEVRKQFELQRTIICKPGVLDSVTIPLSDLGSFEQEGYNISYTTQTTEGVEGTAPVKLRFRSQADNAGQSNDFLPIELISTPGKIGNPRYGFRKFVWTYPKNDILEIQYDGRQLVDEIKINITIIGFLTTGV